MSDAYADPEPLWDIVEEHLDEAEFLWEQWERALVAPNYTLAEVAEGPEERLMAHLDGLVVNGPQVAERLLIPTLGDVDAEPTRVRAAALALLQSPGDEGIEAVIGALIELPPQRPELARALECSDRDDLALRLAPLLATDDLDLRHAAARALAFHGAELPAIVPALLASGRAVDRGLGLRLVPRLADASRFHREVLAALAADDPDLRDVALSTGAVLGLPQAWRRAQELAHSGDPTAGHALLLLALRGDPADGAALLAAPGDAARRGAALWALGFLGSAAAAEAALPWLEDEAHARVAGEAFAAITGLDLEDAHLTRDPPEDEALEHRPEDDLPLADPMGALKWWRAHRERFAGAQRLLAGEPRGVASLGRALRDGPMRRRAAHLLALQIEGRSSGRPQLELLAPSRRQFAELAAFHLIAGDAS